MHSIAGILLSGGQSSRMGQDKSLLLRDHRNMYSYTLDTLEPLPLTTIYISRNPWQVPYLTKYPVIKDLLPNNGPISGLHAVMEKSSLDGFLVVPIDLPLIETYDLEKLLSMGNQCHRPVHFKHHFLPLYLPNSRDIKQYINHVIRNKHASKSIMKLCLQFDAVVIEPNDEIRLSNTNTPDQWREAELSIYEL